MPCRIGRYARRAEREQPLVMHAAWTGRDGGLALPMIIGSLIRTSAAAQWTAVDCDYGTFPEAPLTLTEKEFVASPPPPCHSSNPASTSIKYQESRM